MLQYQSSHYDNYAKHYALNKNIIDPHLVYDALASKENLKLLQMDAKRHELSKQKKKRVTDIQQKLSNPKSFIKK